jgi:4-hydroxybenzoate polyprenyltransferase
MSLIAIGFFMEFSTLFYFFLLVPILHLFFYQINNFNFKNPKNSLKIFKTNNILGFVILFNILIGKV